MNGVVERKEKFVRIPMKMFAYGTEHYVTDDEIAVYYELGYHCWGRDVSISHINVELLHARLKWNNGKNRIIKALSGLKTKNYIFYNCDDVKATSYLTVNMPKERSKLFEEEVVVDEKLKLTGWTGITESIMNICKQDKVKTGQRLKVITYIMWRANLKKTCDFTYRISFPEWANVLQMTERQANRVIDSLKRGKIIRVTSGAFYYDNNNLIRQEINKYDVPELKAEDDSDYKPTMLDKKRKVAAVAELLLNTIDERVKVRSNLFEYGSTLSVEDMVIYLTTECKLVKEYGVKRFNSLSKTESGKAMVESWTKKAKKEIEKTNRISTANASVEPDLDMIMSEFDTRNSVDEVAQKRKKEEYLRKKEESETRMAKLLEGDDKKQESNEFDFDDDGEDQEPNEVHIEFMARMAEKRKLRNA